MTDSADEIFARLRSVQGATLESPAIVRALEELGGAPVTNMPDEELVSIFLERLDSQQTSVTLAPDRGGVVRALSEYVYSLYRNRKVVSGFDARLAALPWRDGGILVRFDAASPEDRVGVSYAKVGVAESGSLAVYCDRSNPASNNWLVQNHIILLDEADLVATYEQAWARLRELQENQGSPRGISFISGPSSTSDIMAEKVFGAHGPGSLHVILVGSHAASLPTTD